MKQAIEVEVKIGADYVKRQSIDLGDEGREMLSPYNIPKFARVWHDDHLSQFHLEFKYSTPNEPKDLVEVDRVVFRVGKFSRKLYSVTVNDVPFTLAGARAALEDIIQLLERQQMKYDVQQLEQRTPFWNLSLAKDFVREKEDDLLALAY